MNRENRMADGEQFHSRLARFTGDQKNMIADMAAADCVLKEIWEAAVFAFITGNEWHLFAGRLSGGQRFMTHRRKGRKKGEKIGEGPIQILIRKRGGRRYVTRLYQEYRSADAVAQYIYNGFHLYCHLCWSLTLGISTLL